MVSILPRVTRITHVSSPYKTSSRHLSYDGEDLAAIDINSQYVYNHSAHMNPRKAPEMVEISRSASRPHHHRRRTSHETSSSSEDLTHHESSRQRRHRRRRRSSEAETSHIPRSTPDHHERYDYLGSRRSSLLSLPVEQSYHSVSGRASVERSIASESGQRSRSRRSHTSRSSRPDPETQIIEEVSESDRGYSSRVRRTRSTSGRSIRPSLVRSSTSVRHGTNAPSLATVREETTSQRPRPPQRSHSVWSTLLSPSRPPVPEVKVSCLTCMDDVPISKAPKLTCGHHMCCSCLKRIFTLSVSDPAHMPPKCCTEDCIPLKHVSKLFDDRFKMRWNRKYQEYTTKNRLYCPVKGCGSWIPPKDIARDRDGRKSGTCRKCKTQVCAACNGKRHKSKECPKDAETQRFAEMVKNNGWQSCYNCSATVELKEGCNHMTCRCTAQFCMICGSKWKTCDCPWFNHTAAFANNIDINMPQGREEMAQGGAVAFAQPLAYQEEVDRRREQERQDEAFARQLEGIDLGLGGPYWDPWRPLARQRPPVGNLPALWPNNRPAAQLPFQVFAGVIPETPFHNIPAPPTVQQQQQQQQTERPRLDSLPRILRPTQPQRTPSIELPTALRRSATTTASRTPRKAVQESDSEDDAGTESDQRKAKNRQSAMLAGLNRASDKGRVDSWRRYVHGEPVVSPLL